MNDPYMPLEKDLRLTRRALEKIADHGFPVHTITKSDLVLRDADLFEEIQAKTYAAVTFTVTSADDEMSRKLEPGAPVSSRRMAALRELRGRGLLAGITMMPLLPYIEDTQENVHRIVTLAAEHGARYILPAFGMTLRDRQRAYYYDKLDGHFPGLRRKYETSFGERYSAAAREAHQLESFFRGLCEEHGIATRMPVFTPRAHVREATGQPRLL
jgi:DNA repair photolyase